MTSFQRPASADFLARVGEFLALQSQFSRKYNLLPSHWLTLHAALASVHHANGHWICSEFSTAEIARDSLTSRETVRRSIHWLMTKGLLERMKRRYVVSALTIAELRLWLGETEAGFPDTRYGLAARRARFC